MDSSANRWTLPHHPALLAVLLTALAACGDSTTGGQTDTGSDTADVLPDVPADTDDAVADTDGAGDATTDATDASDLAETDIDEGGGVGDPCEIDADCASGECVVLAGGVPGICTSFCSTGADCPEGFDCILLTNSGADAAYLCIPRDYCADADGDRFGVGPGCLGIDCDGIDNDCDGEIDNEPTDVTTWYRDVDEDRFGDPDDSVVACAAPEG